MDGRALAATTAPNQNALLLKQLQSSDVHVAGLKANLGSHSKLYNIQRDQSAQSWQIGPAPENTIRERTAVRLLDRRLQEVFESHKL